MLRASTPMIPTNADQSLFILRNADMQSTGDQAFTRQFAGVSYVVTNIIAVRKSGAYSVACVGGIYSGAAKSGDQILSALQSWAGLVGAGSVLVAAISNLLQSKIETANPVLSLTTGNLAALTCDIFIVGTVVD